MLKPVPHAHQSSSGATPLDVERDAIRELPARDWARIWATLPSRELPRHLAVELQLSIAETCVQSFTYISALAGIAATIVTLTLVPAETGVGRVWIAFHLLDYVLITAAVVSLQRHRRNGTLSAARVNAILVAPILGGALVWGTLPTVVGADQIELFYLAMNVSVPFCVFGCFWPVGHWPLSMSYVFLNISCLAAGFWQANLPEASIVAMLGPVLWGVLFVLSTLACVALVYARYYEVSAREREQLIGLMLQDYERGGQDFLWEADTSMKLTHVPQRMITAGRGDPRIVPGGSLMDLLFDQPEVLNALETNAPFQALIPTHGDSGNGELRLWGRPKAVSGRPMGYRGVGSDEGAARRAAEAERTSERLDAMVTLTSGLAHDFNNQLASVMGAVELASLEPTLSDRASGYLQRAIDACLRTRRITADLVVASGYDGSYQPARFEVTDALRAVIDDVGHLFPTVALRIEAPDEAWVDADRSHFMRAAQNLLQNACQAIVEANIADGTVVTTVTTSSGHDPMVTTTISDNGPGISANVAGRIFEPFSTSRRAQGGTGLGLSVARGFAHQAGGSLELVTAEGGASFEVRLPMVAAPIDLVHNLPARTNSRPDAARLTGRFVIVEDDPAVAENILAWIESVGGTGETVGSVTEAIERYAGATEGVECVICDLALADGEGFEVIAALRKKDPELRAVYMSGFTRTLPSSVDPRLRCPFLAKPFAIHELVATLQVAGVQINRQAV